MNLLVEWVRRLVLLVIVVSFLELLAPPNNLRRYVRLVTGFLVLTAVLAPLVALVRGGDVLGRIAEAVELRLPTGNDSRPASGLAETDRQLQNALFSRQLTTYLEQELAETAGGRVGVAVRVDGRGALEGVMLATPPGRGARVRARAAALTGLEAGKILVVEEAIP
ncbi:MAG: stage III sporulation protein AF [Bacillota bacterium]|nr:stage III sporulation protein AF [Bacillota bacterium]